jgi:hypothetical protein
MPISILFLGIDDPVAPVRSRLVAFSKFEKAAPVGGGS